MWSLHISCVSYLLIFSCFHMTSKATLQLYHTLTCSHALTLHVLHLVSSSSLPALLPLFVCLLVAPSVHSPVHQSVKVNLPFSLSSVHFLISSFIQLFIQYFFICFLVHWFIYLLTHSLIPLVICLFFPEYFIVMKCLNPLNPMSDQYRISPYNINTKWTRKWWE